MPSEPKPKPVREVYTSAHRLEMPCSFRFIISYPVHNEKSRVSLVAFQWLDFEFAVLVIWVLKNVHRPTVPTEGLNFSSAGFSAQRVDTSDNVAAAPCRPARRRER